MNRKIITLLSAIIGIGLGVTIVGKSMIDKVSYWQKMSNKHLLLFEMMNQWVNVKQKGKNLSYYFQSNNIEKIAIYGMSYAGKTLVEELKNTDIIIKYAIDKNAENIYSDVDIVTMEDELEEVDAIVVTAITFFNEIAEKLAEKVECQIISLEDILNEM